jgi:hypothetical protein
MLALVLAMFLSGPAPARPVVNASSATVARPVLVSRVRAIRRRGAVLRRNARVSRRPIARRRGGR